MSSWSVMTGPATRVRDIADAWQMVLDFFDADEEKAELWFRSPNRLLGNIKPVDMILMGRSAKLLNWIYDNL